MVDFDAQVEGLHIEQRGRALAQRYPGRWSSSGPNGEVGRGPTTRLAVDRTSKLFVNDGNAKPRYCEYRNRRAALERAPRK